MTIDEVRELLANKKIGPLSGFVSKFGKPYSASLILDENWKVKFDFNAVDAASVEPIDVSNAVVVGVCPLCKGKIYAAENHFVCEHSSYVTKSEHPRGFHVARLLLGFLLSDDHMKQLLNNGKTELIDGFTSKRTGKRFSAYLLLKSNGGIGFEFPPREKAEKKGR